MKRVLLVLLVLVSLTSQAQDTTKVRNLQLTARLVYYLMPQMAQPANDSLFQVLIDLRPKLRIANPPIGQTLVTIDSIPTVELANLYNFALNTPSFSKIGTNMQAQLVNARAANTYLESLCLAFENFYDGIIKNQIQTGKKMVTGKNQ